MTRAQEKLVIEHIGFARSIALGLARKFPRADRDDLVSAAFVGLVEAARAYRKGPVPFGGFARGRVRGAVLDHLRADDLVRVKMRVEQFRARPWPISIDALFSHPAETPSPEDTVIAANLIDTAGRNLSRQAKAVLGDRLAGTLAVERAQKWGVSETRVCQILRVVRAEVAAAVAA